MQENDFEKNKMKIGILSMNTHTKGLNYACPLHTYAFQQFLQKKGMNSIIIDYKANYYGEFNPRHPSDYYEKVYEKHLKQIPDTEEEMVQWEKKAYTLKRKKDGYAALYQERETRYDNFETFIKKYYHITDRCYDLGLLEVIDPNCDCYICATDVVWKKQVESGFDRVYFLGSSTMDNKWKIAYSASRGVPKPYTDEDKKIFFDYLNDFDYISVREKSLKEYIEQNSDLKASVLIDPVLLHDKEFYEKIAVKPEQEHYILLYYAEERSKNTVKMAVQYARKYNLQIIEMTNLPIKDGIVNSYAKDIASKFVYDAGPDEWLGYIMYADYVFTNSFHASCFSILFQKEFYVGSRHGDKIQNLCEIFGVSERIIPGNNKNEPGVISFREKCKRKARQILEEIGLGKAAFLSKSESELYEAKQIDFNYVREVLEKKRAEAENFLLTAIQNMQGKVRTPHDYDTFRKTLTYTIRYNSFLKNVDITSEYDTESGTLQILNSGTVEYTPETAKCKNDGTSCFMENKFCITGYHFVGWNIRIRIDKHWFWYLDDGSLKLKREYSKSKDRPKRRFQAGDCIPYIPVNEISVMIAEAVWERDV